MRKSIDFNYQKTESIGKLVKLDYFKHYTQAFTEHFSVPISFSVEKSLIKSILSQSDQVKGIRFLWGLKDEFNIYSSELFMIPCGSANRSRSPIYPLLFEQGYHDTNGDLHSIETTCQMSSHFVKSVKRIKSSFPYKTITRAAFFGSESLLAYINQSVDSEIEIHLGYDTETELIIPIFTSPDKVSGPFMNTGCPCPPYCCDLGESCVATLAVQQNSDEAVLDSFREFRDTHLLNLPKGATYYEMYYFLTPLVRSEIDKSEDKGIFLDNLYNNTIIPFSELLKQGKDMQALETLSNTLSEWSNEYIIETV